MRIVEANAELICPPSYDEVLKRIEICGRVCYKSEDKISDGSAEKFIRMIIRSGHESVLEHSSITVKFICDRGVTHEIVRHRMASYSQESTRYCNYSKDKFGGEVKFIKPCYLNDIEQWKRVCESIEKEYLDMLNNGAKPQEARAILPNSLATELCMTANLREWRHFFKLRTAQAAHPQMREVANILLNKMKEKYPVFFEDM